jgi:hypothetical protein
MPPVTAVVPAVKVVEAPLVGVIEPSVMLVRAHTKVIPVLGQVALHVVLAVKPCVPLKGTEGNCGVTDTDFRVMAAAVTVITVEVDTVVTPSVALTYMPTVPAVVTAVNVVVGPAERLIEPNVVLVRAHAYVIPVAGQVALHVGVAVNDVALLMPTAGAFGETATDMIVMGNVVTVITVEVPTVVPLRVALT